MDPAFVEPTPRLELGTSFLPRMCSTTELCGLGTPWFKCSFAPCLVQGVGFEPTKHKAADLQSAGFDRSPIPAQTFILTQLRIPTCQVTRFVTAVSAKNMAFIGPFFGAPGGIRTRQPANYKSAALPLRHWGMNLNKVEYNLFSMLNPLRGRFNPGGSEPICRRSTSGMHPGRR